MGGLVDRAEARRRGNVPGEVIEGHDGGAALAKRFSGSDGEGCGAQERHLEDLHVQAHVEPVISVPEGMKNQRVFGEDGFLHPVSTKWCLVSHKPLWMSPRETFAVAYVEFSMLLASFVHPLP